MRSIGVVTTSRADYGIYQPVLEALRTAGDVDLRLLVSGSHLSPEFGSTVREIECDGYPISERVTMLLSGDDPEAISKATGLGVIGFAQAFARSRPDILLVLGDRFEMHAAALAALPFRIPVAHVHGGEVTEGAIDDALRHSLTKLSHLHFASTEAHARRLVRLGEEPWRVTVSGAPALDGMARREDVPLAELEATCGMALPERGFLLVTFHPATMEHDQAATQVEEVLSAVQRTRMPVLFTMPNADTAGRAVRERIREHLRRGVRDRAVESLGSRRYWAVMARAAVMVGNSSSGIVEAPSLELPVVNVGTRQAGRTRAANVIDVEPEREAITRAIAGALAVDFRGSLAGLRNPYGDGRAACRIVERLRTQAIDDRLVRKRFYEGGPDV